MSKRQINTTADSQQTKPDTSEYDTKESLRVSFRCANVAECISCCLCYVSLHFCKLQGKNKTKNKQKTAIICAASALYSGGTKHEISRASAKAILFRVCIERCNVCKSLMEVLKNHTGCVYLNSLPFWREGGRERERERERLADPNGHGYYSSDPFTFEAKVYSLFIFFPSHRTGSTGKVVGLAEWSFR